MAETTGGADSGGVTGQVAASPLTTEASPHPNVKAALFWE